MLSVVSTVLTFLFLEGLGVYSRLDLPLYCCQCTQDRVRLFADGGVCRPAFRELDNCPAPNLFDEFLKRLVTPQPFGAGGFLNDFRHLLLAVIPVFLLLGLNGSSVDLCAVLAGDFRGLHEQLLNEPVAL